MVCEMLPGVVAAGSCGHRRHPGCDPARQRGYSTVYAKQKHLGFKKYEANKKQHYNFTNRHVRPTTLISAEVKSKMNELLDKQVNAQKEFEKILLGFTEAPATHIKI